MRVRVAYFDHNEALARQLPVTATVERSVRVTDSSLPWFLLHLDAPLIHESVTYSQALVASRWEGEALWGKAPVSAHLLLVALNRPVFFGGSAV